MKMQRRIRRPSLIAREGLHREQVPARIQVAGLNWKKPSGQALCALAMPRFQAADIRDVEDLKMSAKRYFTSMKQCGMALAVGLLSVGLGTCAGSRARPLGATGGRTLETQRYADAQAVLLLEEVELTYAFDTIRFLPYAELRRHRRIQILTEEGRKRFSRIYVPLSETSTPRDIQARLVHVDGSYEDLAANRTLDFQRFDPKDPAASLYQEPGARAFGVRGVRLGDVIDYQSLSVIRDPRWVEPLIAGEELWDLPIKEAVLSVVHAPGFDVDMRLTERGVLTGTPPERVPARIFDPIKGDESKLDATRFAWFFRNLPPSFPEPRGSTPNALATQVHVQFRKFVIPDNPKKAFVGYSTWEDVAAWYRDLVGRVDGSGVALAPDAQNAKTKKEKLKAIQKGCGQLDLLDVEFNLGSLKPHKPPQVISAKKGDAKDIAQACLSATRAAGLDAFPVLLARRGHRPAVPDLPTPAAFDHVIIAVPGPGTYEFFDPAGLGVPTGRPMPWSQGTDGILVRPDGVERVRIPEDRAEDNTREITYKLTLTQDAFVEGSASLKLFGQDAALVQQVLKRGNNETALLLLSEWLCGGDQKLKWADAQLVGDVHDADAPLRLLVTFQRAELGGLPGKLAVRMDELLGRLYPFLWRDGRVTPVDLGYLLTERVVASVHMPDGHGVQGRPRDLVHESDLMKVEQRYVVADGALWLRRNRIQKAAYIQPEQYSTLKESVEAVWRNLEQSVSVVSGGDRGKQYGDDPF
jgi:hypothetical protein